MNKPTPKTKKEDTLPPPSPRLIKVTNDDSGISGILMVKNPVSKKLRDKIIREWSKAPKLIICHDNLKA
jgi:hypothetical protein